MWNSAFFWTPSINYSWVMGPGQKSIITCSRRNFMGGSCLGIDFHGRIIQKKISWGQQFRKQLSLGGEFIEVHCPQGELFSGNCPAGVHFGGNCPGGNFIGDNYLVGCCPGLNYSGVNVLEARFWEGFYKE